VSSTGATDGPTFEQLLSELEAITEQLAAGDIGIESAADLYERAVQLHGLASAKLDQVKTRVERLTGGDRPRQASP
jgi:exodeoxyribonuclease VII small subunit